MARPIKNNADYFPHDADMRNDPRVKALRRKFGIEGYGVYCMLIELLADSDFFQFKNDSMNIEIVAGDFDIEPDKLTSILFYLNQIDLIQLDAGTNLIKCKSLDNRLDPLLSKRKRDRNEVIDSDNTQSKGEESIVDESKPKQSEGESDLLSFLGIEISLKKILDDELWNHNIQPMLKGKNLKEAGRAAFLYLQTKPHRFKTATINDLKRTTISWLENKKPETISTVDQRERLKNL